MALFGVIVLVVYAAALSGLLFPAQLRLNRMKFVAQLISFPALLVLGGAAGSLLGLVLGVALHSAFWIWVMVLSIVFTIAAVLQMLQLGLNNREPMLAGDSVADLVIMGWNTLGDSVPVTVLRDAILLHQPDAVGLPETTRPHQEALVAALVEAGYPMHGYTVGPQDGHDPHETSLLIKQEYGEHTIQRLNILGASTLEATPVDPTAPTFVAVHTVAPTLDRHAAWAEDLAALAKRYRGARRTVLVGDFNATVVHMRNLAGGTGVLGFFVDTAEETRSAAYATWPVGKSTLLGTQIDHVLHTPDYTGSAFSVLTDYDDTGSDHRAILATVTSGR